MILGGITSHGIASSILFGHRTTTNQTLEKTNNGTHDNGIKTVSDNPIDRAKTTVETKTSVQNDKTIIQYTNATKLGTIYSNRYKKSQSKKCTH